MIDIYFQKTEMKKTKATSRISEGRTLTKNYFRFELTASNSFKNIENKIKIFYNLIFNNLMTTATSLVFLIFNNISKHFYK